VGPAFTYQGQLKDDAGNPITASCDFEFTLWTLHLAESRSATPAQRPASAWSLATLPRRVNAGGEFGSVAFVGEERWLEVSVQCAGDPAYTTLSPRQALNPAPLAFALPGLYTQPNLLSPNIIGGYFGNTISSSMYGRDHRRRRK